MEDHLFYQATLEGINPSIHPSSSLRLGARDRYLIYLFRTLLNHRPSSFPSSRCFNTTRDTSGSNNQVQLPDRHSPPPFLFSFPPDRRDERVIQEKRTARGRFLEAVILETQPPRTKIQSNPIQSKPNRTEPNHTSPPSK